MEQETRSHPRYYNAYWKGDGGLIGLKEIIWLNPDGHEMSVGKWNEHFARCLGVYRSGAAMERSDGRGRRLAADAQYPLQGRSLVLLRETAYR